MTEARVLARAEVGINFVRWDARFLFYRDLPPTAEVPRQRVTTPVKDCWLYIFDPFGPLLYEVYADSEGMYHDVDVTKHAGKDIRPFAMEGHSVRSTLPLLAGQRTTKGTVSIFHWVLPSPFQLPWSRFPHITHVEANNDGPRGDFRKWAEGTRNLHHFMPTWQDEATATLRDPSKPAPEVAIPCPWLHSQALNRCFQIAQERWLSRILNNTARCQQRILCSYVRTVEAVVGKARFEKKLDELILKDDFLTEEAGYKDDEEVPAELVGARKALIAYLTKPQYLAMRDDALASPDPRALATFTEIHATAESGLEGLAGDPEFRKAFFKDNPALFKKEAEELSNTVKAFLDGNPEAMYGQPTSLGWKEQRKALKSYWYLVKAYIAQIDFMAPRRVANELKFFGRELFGVLVDFDFPDRAVPQRMPSGTIKWPRLVVSQQAKAHLLEKYSNNITWNTFFVVLDGYNLIMACREQAKGKTDMKPVVSAMGSFLNTAAGAIEATMQRHGARHLIVTNKMLAELAGEAGKGKQMVPGSFEATLRKFNQPKTIGALGKFFGILGSGWEMWSSWEKADKAAASLDDEAVVAHRISATANAVTTAGYVLGMAGAVCVILAGSAVAWPLALVAIGSWLVFGGTATDLGIKLALPSLESDPLENWMRVSPWGRKVGHRLPSYEEQVEAFQKALVGLSVNFRPGLTGFDVTIESRVAAHVFLELEWVSDVGRMKNEMAPMAAAEQIGRSRFRHEEITSPVKQVTAKLRLLLDGEFYPAGKPAEFKYPS